MSDTNEALKIWSSLQPMIDRRIAEKTKSCIRSKKMIVVTAPNGSTIGVRDPMDTAVINIPYSSGLTYAKVGDSVWVQWYYDNASTMIAMYYGGGNSDMDIIMKSTPYSQITLLSAADTYMSLSDRTFTVQRRGYFIVVFITFQLIGSATTSGFVQIGTLPADLRPNRTYTLREPIQGKTTTVSLQIRQDGILNFARNTTDTGYIQTFFTVPVSDLYL